MLKLIVCIFSLILAQIGTTQGIEFFQGTWAQTLEEAKAENKLIFVDAYAVWCGPCKKMTKNVFPQKQVGEYYNAHFINVKLDMERGEGLKFKKKYPVRAFPTFFYISPAGEIVLSVTGYRQPNDFVEVGRKAIERYDPSAELAIKYEKGERSPEVVLAYIGGLNKAGKSSLAVANEYLRSQENLATQENLAIIFEATTEADSRIFDYLIKYRNEINKLKTKPIVDAKIAAACQKTTEKAFEFEIQDLLMEAQSKMRQHLPSAAPMFAHHSNIQYASLIKDEKLFSKSSKSYLTGNNKNDPQKLNEIANLVIDHFNQNPALLSYAEKLAKKATNIESNSGNYLTHARILHLQGKSSKALEMVDMIIKMATDKNELTRDILQFKQELENS